MTHIIAIETFFSRHFRRAFSAIHTGRLVAEKLCTYFSVADAHRLAIVPVFETLFLCLRRVLSPPVVVSVPCKRIEHNDNILRSR